MDKQELGRLGEELARDYLLDAGYTILAHNYRTQLGEIDLIAKENDTIIFVEVRTRSTPSYGTPFESINPIKRERLIRLALQFCAHHCLYSKNLRFDVIGVTFNHYGPAIEHLPNAFIAGGAR